MKTKEWILSLALIVIVSGTALAQSEPSLSVSQSKRDKNIYNVLFKSQGSGEVTLKISNRFNTPIYEKEFVYSNGFMFPLDFKELDNGNYKIEVTGGKINLSQVLEFKHYRPVAYVKVTKPTEGKYLVFIESKTKADFNIEIFDRWNSVVYSNTETVSKDLIKAFDVTAIVGPVRVAINPLSKHIDVVKR